jgi:hypothetical protein
MFFVQNSQIPVVIFDNRTFILYTKNIYDSSFKHISGGEFMDRLVLRNVPRVNFYEGGVPACPEDIPFPSVMRALMEYFKEENFGCRSCHALKPGCKIPCSYSFFMGVSGAASFLSWKPGWEGDNPEIMYMSDDPRAPFDRAFQAAGYEYQYIDSAQGEAIIRQRIMDSIQKGRPVLAFGPIGPPESAIITGYDEGGDILIGWSFFQTIPPFNEDVEFEPSGQFRKRHWFDYPPGFSIITFGDKQEQPPLPKTYRQTLEWMVKVARTPLTWGNRHNGLAAYTAWADHLVRDEDFPNDEAILRQRYEVHNSATSFVAEARWYGSKFLIQTSDPDDENYRVTEDLLHAAACYAAEHELMWKLWDLAGGIVNPDAYRCFADPAIRRQMVPIIQQARDKDIQAIDYIEQALTKM